jgi:uncharacterized protein YbjT (DUF2867 family)
MSDSRSKHRRTAVIAGATGLVGSALLVRLLASPDHARIFALTRRALEIADPRLQPVAARFDDLDSVLNGVQGPALDVFCCLGTTIAKAGSQAAFRLIDHDAVVALARWARAARARRFVLVSAIGANAASRVFYNRVKGEAEAAVRNEGPASVVILRPGLLDGERAEFRPGERLALAVTRPLRAILPATLRPVAAEDVAAAMLEAARAAQPPAFIESAAIQGAALRIG